MTKIVVSKRDGIVRAPDGTKHRVARGKTLADARHPVVEAYPNDWSPMVVALAVDDPDGDTVLSVSDAHERLVQLENDLAEIEEVAEHRGRELLRLAEALDEGGLVPDPRPSHNGWLVDLVLELLPLSAAAPSSTDEQAVIAPSRAARKPRVPRA